MALRMFQALPPYHGGKRRLLPHIFRHVPPPSEAPTFVDAFLGGGAVSLYAKARGYRVICNDVAERSSIIGHALIENNHAMLEYDDLVRLFLPVEGSGYAERCLAPDVFPTKHARFLDAALGNAGKLRGPKKWLSLLLVVKYALRLRPMGNWGAKTIVHQMEDGDYESMNPNYVRDVFARQIPLHPKRIAETTRQAINRGVFSNDQANEVCGDDVFDFLAHTEGDVLYADPPYHSTQSYEQACRPLDELLQGGRVKSSPSAFTREPPESILPRLFEAAAHFPLWVLSYGNQAIDLQGLIGIVRRFRPVVEAREIKHAHCTGLASEESRSRNRELLVVGRS